MRLPETWNTVRLGDVSEINPRLDLPENLADDTVVSFLPMAAVDEVNGEIVRLENKAYKQVAKGFTPFKDGDVLFAKITPSMENGKAAVAKGLANGIGFGSTEFHVIRPSALLLADFLFYFIRQEVFRKYARASFVGSAGQQRVPSDFLGRVKIPLPTRPEQQRIVDILQQAEKLRQMRRAVIDQTKKLSSAFFLEMFGDPDPRRSRRWPTVILGSIIKVETGGTPRRSNKAFFKGNINWVKSTELIDDVISGTEEKITDEGLASSNTKIFPPSTILLAMYGQGQTRGRTGKLIAPASCNQACAAFLPDKELLPDYLWIWLQSSYQRIRDYGRGGQQANLNLDIIKNLRIPKPPIELQLRFSHVLVEIGRQIRRLQEAETAWVEVKEDFLSAAFTGDLTTIWREVHKQEINLAVTVRDEIIVTDRVKVSITEHAPEQWPFQVQRERFWLKNQLSDLQGFVWTAMKEWPGTLIPSDQRQMDEFREQWPIEHLKTEDDKILRAIVQLADVGLLTRITLPNSRDEYVTGFRSARPEEMTKEDDILELSEARG